MKNIESRIVTTIRALVGLFSWTALTWYMVLDPDIISGLTVAAWVMFALMMFTYNPARSDDDEDDK